MYNNIVVILNKRNKVFVSYTLKNMVEAGCLGFS